MTGVVGCRPSVRGPVTDWFAICGYRWAVTSGSATARRLLHRLYGARLTGPPVSEPGADHFLLDPPQPGDRCWRLSLAGEGAVAHRTLGGALHQLEFEVCRRVLGQRDDQIAVHGATVLAAGGATGALITGPSGAGKTMLSLALAARGYRVGGDDIALLEVDHRALRPFPRCFHLDAAGWRLTREIGLAVPPAARRHRFLTLLDVGDPPLGGAVPVRYVFFVGRGAGPHPRLTPLSQAETVAGLLPQLSASTDAPATAIAALRSLTAESLGYRLLSGGLARSAAAVARVLGPP